MISNTHAHTHKKPLLQRPVNDFALKKRRKNLNHFMAKKVKSNLKFERGFG